MPSLPGGTSVLHHSQAAGQRRGILLVSFWGLLPLYMVLFTVFHAAMGHQALIRVICKYLFTLKKLTAIIIQVSRQNSPGSKPAINMQWY